MFKVKTAEPGIICKVSVGFQFIETDLNYPLCLFILVSDRAAKKTLHSMYTVKKYMCCSYFLLFKQKSWDVRMLPAYLCEQKKIRAL